MSATMTPPIAVDAPVDTAAELPRPTTARISTGSDAASSPVTPVGRSTGRISDALFFSAWVPAFTVASVVGALALAVSTPILMARVVYGERRYR
jgi:hypothetical protein